RRLDEKNPLPRVQNALAPRATTTVMKERKPESIIEIGEPQTGKGKTATTLIGGLGLFLIIVGWHKLRRPKRPIV
ncbi:MAG TPA: LPXTG cell wall anchor domain-containing protein, partial [Pyrinomonadaceae bacterium]